MKNLDNLNISESGTDNALTEKSDNKDFNNAKTDDVFLRKNDILKSLPFGKTKLNEMIKKGMFINPITIEDFNQQLFSLNELNIWMKEKKKNRK